MKKSIMMLSAVAILGFAACSDDDSDDATPATPTVNTTPRVMVSNQVTNRNVITVSEIYVAENGFAVVHRDNGSNGPVTPGIISDVATLNAGLNTNVKITLSDSIADGEKLWVMAHNDVDDDGIYNFPNGNGGSVDGPVMVDGNILMSSLEITAPSIMGASSLAVTNNTITIPSVEAAVDGWLVVHYFEAGGLGGAVQVEPIAGKVKVNAGMNTNVMVNLNADSTYASGRVLFPMLHINANNDDNYDFPGGVDEPEIFSNAAFPSNVVFVQTTVQ